MSVNLMRIEFALSNKKSTSNLPIFVFTYLGSSCDKLRFWHVEKDIEDLILNKRFVPFPPRPKAYQLDLNSDPHIHQQPIPEEYPSKDGFENNRQLNVIARGILIHPDLVNLWKQIGYYEICNDVNDLVMQGALHILFPPTPASDWSCPSIEMHRLDEIGDILWDAFLVIRSGENVFSLAFKFFREAFKPERNLKKDDLLNFLKSKFDYHEQVIKQVVKQYFIEEKMSDITLRRKSLILSPKIYQCVLKTYSKDSELTVICFEEIHEIWKKYRLFHHLATSLEIIKPFFEIFLPTIFGMKPTSKRGKSTPKKRKKLTDELVVPWRIFYELLQKAGERNYIPNQRREFFCGDEILS
ncbi:hypothetical protein GLOIN_2v1469324 [Rhizophagus irregularis DAOM 181602=DAOM 197198]|nr:hypothetical protein GLOIN_2v1469324 [Rhizophagus irregularis DAOM 181602=DAOM 197198]